MLQTQPESSFSWWGLAHEKWLTYIVHTCRCLSRFCLCWGGTCSSCEQRCACSRCVKLWDEKWLQEGYIGWRSMVQVRCSMREFNVGFVRGGLSSISVPSLCCAALASTPRNGTVCSCSNQVRMGTQKAWPWLGSWWQGRRWWQEYFHLQVE